MPTLFLFSLIQTNSLRRGQINMTSSSSNSTLPPGSKLWVCPTTIQLPTTII
jgi:hypothetical protein